MKYDLHIHSALSPCAEREMTPANIAGFACLAGAELISIADHNSALNLPAAKCACDAYGIKLLPAIETNTAEEIHLLCYFPSVEAALEMGRLIYLSLPDVPVDTSVWSEQLVLDEDDNIIDKIPKLLTTASSYDIYAMKRLCESLGGIAVPAHADKDSFSVLSVLGFMPDDLVFSAVELARPHKYAELCEKKLLPEGLYVLSSSDSHALSTMREVFYDTGGDFPLASLLSP